MNRHQFLGQTTALSAGLAFSRSANLAAQEPTSTDWRTFELLTHVEVLNTEGVTRAWVPVPNVTDLKFQKTLSNTFQCEGGTVKTEQQKAEALGIISAEFPAGVRPVLTVTSRIATRNWSVDLDAPRAPKISSAELNQFLQPTKLIPTGGIVKQRAIEITKNWSTYTDKARVIYNWIVENTYRNPKTRGCGIGDIRFMLESGDLGGKCADINALYVGLARAAGLPARDVYGIRVAKSQMGCKSLGLSSDNATKAQHCRAEVYLSDYGWAPVDPADVRKVMLEEAPGTRPLDDEMVQKTRARLFGSWEMNWIAYNLPKTLFFLGRAGRRSLLYVSSGRNTGRSARQP